MSDYSNTACYAHARENDIESEGQEIAPSQPTHYPKSPCLLVAVNSLEFVGKLHEVADKLANEGLRLEVTTEESQLPWTANVKQHVNIGIYRDGDKGRKDHEN